MRSFTDWNEIFQQSFQNVWLKVTQFLPEIFAALLVLIIGLIIAKVVAKIVKKILTYTHIDRVMNNSRSIRKLQESGMDLSLSDLIAGVVQWFFIILTFLMVVNILHLDQVNAFLESIILYIPNVVVALIILTIGMMLGRFASDLIRKSSIFPSVKNMAPVLSTVAEWSIVIFSVMASLVQLGIASNLIQILFTGLVGALSLAFGLAFGLGGRERVARLLEELEKKNFDSRRPGSAPEIPGQKKTTGG